MARSERRAALPEPGAERLVQAVGLVPIDPRERGTPRHAGSEMVEPRLLRLKRRLEVAERAAAPELRHDQGDELAPAGHRPQRGAMVMLRGQTLETVSRYEMQDLTQDRATLAHGSVPGVISRGCVQSPCTTPNLEPSHFFRPYGTAVVSNHLFDRLPCRTVSAPRPMSPTERLDEVARLLALGFLRLRARRQAGKSQ